MKKDGNDTQGMNEENNDKIKKQVRDPLSNSSSDVEHTLKQRNNQELNERNTGKTDNESKTPYEMGDHDIEDEDRNPNIIPDDPIEAEQVESEKLRYGFSFEPKEGQMGDETEDEGDLTAEQRKTGNRYRPYLGVDDGEKDDENTASDQELHVTDTGHIGMAFGEDNYVEEEENKSERKNKN